jgi:tetratricopeptide (TPR) repeat protein
VAALRARTAEIEQEPQHALAVLDLAVALRDADRAAEAIASARVASQLLTEQGLTVRAGRAYRLEISLLLLLGRAAEAVSQATTARDALADRGAGPLTLALLDAAVAEALRTIGRPQAALGRLDRAREVFSTAGHVELTVVCDHDRAVLEAELGDAPAAVDDLARARSRFLELRDREAVAACSHNLGLGLHDLRHFNDAIEYFQEARSIFVALGRHAEAASCDQNLGVVLHDLGRFDEAGRRLLAARNRYLKLGAERSAAECDHNLSIVLASLGRAEEASEFAARAVEAGVRGPDDSGPVPASRAGGRSVIQAGEPPA